MSYLNGGNFGHGFWAAGLNQAVGGANMTSNAAANVVISAAIGGTISKVTGGKFANGAYSAAFALSLGEVRSLRHKHANGDSIVEDRVADNSSRTEITLSRGKTTLNLDISNELDVLIDALQSESSTFADDILGSLALVIIQQK